MIGSHKANARFCFCIDVVEMGLNLERPGGVIVLADIELKSFCDICSAIIDFATAEFVFAINLHQTKSLTHGSGPFLRSFQLCSYSRTFQRFMELEGSLLCSQQPSTRSYPEPDRSSPYHLILYPQDPF
jgi:hypothetical protein